MNGQKMKAFSLKSGTRQGCRLSPFIFNIVLGSSSQSNQARKRNKGYSVRKRGSQIVSIWRQHDCKFRRPHHFSPKSPSDYKQLQQSLRIQNQYVRITIITIYQ